MYRKRRALSVLTILFLIYFFAYAVSPLSFSADLSHGAHKISHYYKGFNVFVVQVLLGAIVSADESAGNSSENVAVLFVKKARAVVRGTNMSVTVLIEAFRGLNLLASSMLISAIVALSIISPLRPSFRYRERSGIQEFSGFFSLRSDLSPPHPLF